MIELDVEPYCQDCTLFTAEVEIHERVCDYGFSMATGKEKEYEICPERTIIRCTKRQRCSVMVEYLRKTMEAEKNGF